MSSHGTSQLLSGGDSACKSLTGTLGNQVAFYLCGKGKSECQYLRLYIISQLIFLFHREQDDIFNIHAFSILITSINLLPKREISDTINVSPFFILFNSTPSFLSLADRVPETVSSTHTSIWKSLCLAKRFISNRWFSTVCLSVETRIYAYIIAASLSFLLNKERQSNLYYQRRKVSPDLIEVF